MNLDVVGSNPITRPNLFNDLPLCRNLIAKRWKQGGTIGCEKSRACADRLDQLSAPAPDCRRGRADRTRPAVFPLRDADRLNRFQPVLYLIPRDTVYAVPSPPTLSASSFMRSPTTSAISCARWAMPKAAEAWSLTSLRDKLIKIGAKVVSHGRYVTFQMADRESMRVVGSDRQGTTGEVRLGCGQSSGFRASAQGKMRLRRLRPPSAVRFTVARVPPTRIPASQRPGILGNVGLTA